MRDIEKKFENMSQGRSHGKQLHREPGAPQTNDEDADGAHDTGDGPEDTTQSGMVSDGSGSESDDEGDEDCDPSEGGSSSGEGVDFDELVSNDGYDSYGLADP